MQHLRPSCSRVSKGSSAIGDVAGIIGGPVAPSKPKARGKALQIPEQLAATPRASVPVVALPRSPVNVPTGSTTIATGVAAADSQPRLLEDPDEHSDRITAILPIALLSQVETRVAALRRKKKVSISGYIEAALRELLATGDRC